MFPEFLFARTCSTSELIDVYQNQKGSVQRIPSPPTLTFQNLVFLSPVVKSMHFLQDDRGDGALGETCPEI